MKIIIIYKFTKLANAPDELFSMLNKTKNDNYNIFFIFDNSKKLIELINLHSSDDIIVHFNNRRLNIDELNNKNVHKIIQYHTEPNNGKVDLNVDDSFCKLVLNQYHCTINEYKNCNYIIRNCFVYNEPIVFNDVIKIGYYPSVTRRQNHYYDKGYEETTAILNEIKKLYPNIIIEVKSGISYKECIESKRDCHIIIDECKTGSFHKSTIEGLKVGSVVLVYINNKITDTHIDIYGRSLPVINSRMSSLKEKLIELISIGKESLEELALNNMNIFDEYWNEDIVSKEYFNIYEKLFNS